MNEAPVKYQIGDLVTLVVNGERKGIVTGIYFRPGFVSYTVDWDTLTCTSHFGLELEPWTEFAKTT